jgi:hypothetical protein
MADANRRAAWLTLGVIAIACIAFAVLRLPMVLFASGQMDEQWFAVPGYTVWTEGIPRIPYCPTRRRENFFENADRCLFALPPALHYVQAPFFGLFPAGYPTARAPSFLGGILGLVVVGLLTRKMFGSGFVWAMGLILMAISRPIMFTGITARPDMLCCACMWGSIACMWRWGDRIRVDREQVSAAGVEWELMLAGGLCGLGLLFHPFALVACMQCGVWAVWCGGRWPVRLARGLALAIACIAVLGLWLPLIVRFPYEFQSQFTSNVLERSGPGLVQRLLWPWDSLWHHARYQWEYHQAIQFSFLVSGAVLGLGWNLVGGCETAMQGISLPSLQRRTVWIILSSVYLTATVAGLHPTKGYWVYAIGWLYPLAVLGWTSLVARGIPWPRGWFSGPVRQGASVVWGALLMAIMIPGAGLTTLVAYARDGAGSTTHARLFAERLLEQLPSDARCIVDVHFVFDVWLSGRPTLLCQPRQRFWGDAYPRFDYMIIGREGTDIDAPSDYRATFLRSVGQSSTPADQHVDIYVPLAGDPSIQHPDGEAL